MLTITYIQAMALHIDTQDMFNSHTAHGFLKDAGHGTSVVGVMQTGNTVSSVELEPTYLAFRASVLPLHHVGSLM